MQNTDEITPPKNSIVYDRVSSVWWIDEEGILNSISKKNAPVFTSEEYLQRLQDFKKLAGGKKRCILLDITHVRPSKKSDREKTAEELSKITTALAMISQSVLSRAIAKIFFALKPPPYPTKIFTNATEAKEWLRQYLTK